MVLKERNLFMTNTVYRLDFQVIRAKVVTHLYALGSALYWC